jgi:hypothetical protein
MLGLFSLNEGTLLASYLSSVHIAVFSNAIPEARGHVVVYDLKGSTVGRSAHGASILKDMDFARAAEAFHMTATDARRFQRALRKDVEFLGNAAVMDYSVLAMVITPCHRFVDIPV